AQVRSQITDLQVLEKQLVSLRASCNDDREIEACGVLEGLSEGSMQ
ncbi:MAG: Cd(II)/Pb(II)-responsive transcriptional regulator, partial [Marinobacter sp. 34-60-7]